MEPLIGILVVCAIFAVFLVTASSGSGRKGKSPKKSFDDRYASASTKKSHPGNNWGLADPRNQLAAISKVNFETTRMLNASEFRVFKALERIVEETNSGHRVMAQTSLGELIKPRGNSGDWKERKDAFASINSKRLDFAIINKFGILELAVEYQGSGHHQEKSFMRDAVKREALRRAGVPFLEVEKGTTPKELREQVSKLIAPSSDDRESS